MRYMYLYGNSLAGTLPKQWDDPALNWPSGAWANLLTLQLYNNLLTGGDGSTTEWTMLNPC